MLDDLLGGGVLEMSSTPFRMAEATPAWGDCTVNKVMVLLTVVCFFLIARDFAQMLPILFSTIDRAKANVSLERSPAPHGCATGSRSSPSSPSA